jgi:leucine dehydrogenase
MEITDIPTEGYERVVRCKDSASGLHAIISVHSTLLGPSLGGLRMWPYQSENDALYDVLRLSKGMSYKSAVAHTGLGGGKAVIIGEPAKIKSEGLYLAMGRFIDSLEGRYITAEDVNTTIADLEIVRRVTKHVTGLSEDTGGSGNPSPYTAYGVFLGIRAAVGWKFGTDELNGRSVAIQGVGAVGSGLCRRLVQDGAKVTVADRNEQRVQDMVEELGVTAVPESEILSQDVDVLAPCALGAIINDDTIPTLRCKILAGATNNPLKEPRHGEALVDYDILYAPDYVINSGGIINVSTELMPGGFDKEASLARIERIPKALRELWTIARNENIAPNIASNRLAENILAEARSSKSH